MKYLIVFCLLIIAASSLTYHNVKFSEKIKDEIFEDFNIKYCNLINTKIFNSTIYRFVINENIINYSNIEYCKLINVGIFNSTIYKSVINESIINKSTIYRSVINNSIINNSHIIESTINNCTVINSFYQNTFFRNSTIHITYSHTTESIFGIIAFTLTIIVILILSGYCCNNKSKLV
jgi:hypothetical protein